ncbi:LigB subunit of an aromatic-ring-opening dioxygenase LigAB [Aureobasidium pullulans]|uniref:LigB subunit of an aromatic-ring-opening dioxygenase LigAB n=1 Tax=Aureobasidium pullulans TaxID=5580 RepID=A0A4S9FNH7_AURPU|nr:LigB subunit of an aromatic-ring-opening dioxygenase LigAB [Aureobasidium pullulans]THX49760.1 LigB subunit of an aromatic-ring-opening dioxygenase LigAB [Aureobasidium pullulans]THZ07503.1 LigB subunit of an aromatic-ring-opening dioxygenase LigAB [Aureobasidium pullulans]TIA12716.1 LigB subunit of an aromatic-ring-opening dioxygenase LigAB [Aureobasidium pullulans]TIA33522.1 LigB subunit of an aromatic-ring-opening dioxygenase LigAB [Aureobasidium pullulans]
MTAPVYFLSHGTAFLLQNDSRVRDYWRKIGQEALDNGCKGVIMMAAHWNVTGDNQVKVAMKTQPGMMPLTNAHPDIWKNFKPNTDLKTGQRVIEMLNGAGIEAEADNQFDWMIDSEIALVGMFGDKCPPTVIISQNAYWDPWFHARIGTAIRSLREEGYLIIGSGGGTHNLYRTEWHYALKYRDVFAMESPPDPTNLEFRQALQDVICKTGGGPELKRGLCRLMKHPYFRDAHGTDEHYVSACFVAGAIGEPEDRGAKGVLGAEVWELRSQCESQFSIGCWESVSSIKV